MMWNQLGNRTQIMLTQRKSQQDTVYCLQREMGALYMLREDLP